MKKTVLFSLIMFSLCALKASAQTAPPKDSIPEFSIADSASYTGKYKYEGLPFEYMEVGVKEGKLAYSGGEYKGFLTPVQGKKDVFDANGVALITFLRNGEGKVGEMQIDHDGQIFVGKREAVK